MRKFIPDCSQLTTPLSSLLQKDKPFIWSLECENSFQALKQKLISAPVLQYPDPTKEYQLETDASDKAIGAVLRIQTDQGFKPVAYESRMLSPAEQNYAIHDKELFAIVHALKRWRSYLEGVDKITVLTDHKSLEFFKSQSKLTRRQCGWMEILGNYNLQIVYRPGRELIQADALSRIYIQNSKSEGELDPDWSMCYAHSEKGKYPTDISAKTLETLVKNKDLFKTFSGVVTRKLAITFGSRTYLSVRGWKPS